MNRKKADSKYRYELKYVCSDTQLAQLEQRVAILLDKDPYVNAKGYYTIRSLYFDDYYNSGFWDKENGTDHRKKFRIRIYDGNMDHMSLEIKYKQQDKTRKEKTGITREQYQYMTDETAWMQSAQVLSGQGDPVLNQFLIQQTTKLMKPVIIVEYDRVPYIAAEGNVRITFDRNIRSSAAVEAFPDPGNSMRAIMSTGQHLLEVKFDELLPDYIYRALNLESMMKTSFSKYYLCRKFY